MSEKTKARRAIRRADRQTRRADRRDDRRERRLARREDLSAWLEPLVVAAEGLLASGAARLEWVVSTFFDLVDIDLPGIDDDAVEALVVDAVEALVARLFPAR